MSEPLIQISYSLATIENDVHQFWQYAHQFEVLAFNGDMGAGKTTFIHALCDYLKVKDVVSSPTYALINEYHFEKDGFDKTIYHMDWYRLRNAEEAINAGIEDILNQKDVYIFIEWPSVVKEILPKRHLWIELEIINDHDRLLKAYAKG